ncbi:MAG: hypothetical protein JWO20_1518 [Candidatus Angelobacter sp.]|jgi:hypothetical protein|nr:hypothetical protein [Candidatus Angelobacter sp.]
MTDSAAKMLHAGGRHSIHLPRVISFMPVTYEIDLAKKLIRTACVADVTLEEVKNHFRELERDPNRPDRLNVLLDLCEMTSVPEIWELKAASHEVEKILRSVQFQACAIVACNDVHFGMMRMFEAFSRKHFTVSRVFRVASEAESWLASHELKSNPEGSTPPLS